MDTIEVYFGQVVCHLNRVAFTVGDFKVYWYGVLIALGFLVALVYGFRRAQEFGIKPDPMIDVVITGAIGAVVCARLYYVFTSDGYDTFKKIIDVRDGGLAFYGALIGALLFGGIMCRIRKINVLSMFDIAGSGFLVAQAIGRWGNFINQEAFGTNTTLPWGMKSTKTVEYITSKTTLNPETGLYAEGLDPELAVHPCFLYESIWCIIGFVLIHYLSRFRKFKGEVFLYYIIWYGLGRFFIEGIRTDSLMLTRDIRISQLIAALCVIGGVIALVLIRLKIRKASVAADEATLRVEGDVHFNLENDDEDDENGKYENIIADEQADGEDDEDDEDPVWHIDDDD